MSGGGRRSAREGRVYMSAPGGHCSAALLLERLPACLAVRARGWRALLPRGAHPCPAPSAPPLCAGWSSWYARCARGGSAARPSRKSRRPTSFGRRTVRTVPPACCPCCRCSSPLLLPWRCCRRGALPPSSHRPPPPPPPLLAGKTADKTATGLTYIPAPKLQLPGHGESYNPPPEYLPTEEERNAAQLEDRDEGERPALLPTAHSRRAHGARITTALSALPVLPAWPCPA